MPTPLCKPKLEWIMPLPSPVDLAGMRDALIAANAALRLVAKESKHQAKLYSMVQVDLWQPDETPDRAPEPAGKGLRIMWEARPFIVKRCIDKGGPRFRKRMTRGYYDETEVYLEERVTV